MSQTPEAEFHLSPEFHALVCWRDAHAAIERSEGAEMFLGYPDRWYADPTWRCVTGHVSSSYLKADDGDRCLACLERVVLTFPEDRETDPPTPVHRMRSDI